MSPEQEKGMELTSGRAPSSVVLTCDMDPLHSIWSHDPVAPQARCAP